MFAEKTFVDYGESEFNFANNVRTSMTFMFANGVEKIEFPVFNLISGYEESTTNVISEFQVEGIVEYYPLLYNQIEQSRKIHGISTPFNVDFDIKAEFTNGESVLRGIDFFSCRISDAQITTQTDKEEGFTGKSGFAVVHQLTFTCNGMNGINMYYDDLRGDGPTWKKTSISNEYVELIQNTDKDLSTFATIAFDGGIETIEFSMFKQNEVLSTLDLGEDVIIDKSINPAIELRGIVGNYPMLYNYVDELDAVRGISGTHGKPLVDIDIDLISGEETLRGFHYANCRIIDYDISTHNDKEESYIKNKFALENIFDFECQGYHPNNPTYDAMLEVEKADTISSKDLRNTQDWRSDFTAK